MRREEYVQNIKVKMTREVKYHDLAFVGGVRLWLCSKFTFQLIFESIKNDVFLCMCVSIFVRVAKTTNLNEKFHTFLYKILKSNSDIFTLSA